MKIEKTDFTNVFVINYNLFQDKRGLFTKTISKESFEKDGLSWNFTESFYSVSKKNVLRGMHFQHEPNDHDKLVHVIKGKILDVILDLRFSSKTFGKSLFFELSEENKRGLYIGAGFAHGFLAMDEDSIVQYHTTTSQVKVSEGGILWNSFGFNWPEVSMIISDKDSHFESFDINKIIFQ